MVGEFTHEDGRTWTWKQREASLKLTKQAIAKGKIKPAAELGCKICGQKEGTIEYHNTDYSDPVKYLEPLCYRCHMMVHRKDTPAAKKYFAEVAAGKKYQPITRGTKKPGASEPMNDEPVTITTTTTRKELIDYIGHPCITNWRRLAKLEKENTPVRNGGVCGKCMFRGFLEQYFVDNYEGSAKMQKFMDEVRQNPARYPRISGLLK